MNNPKIYFRITLVVNTLFWIVVLLNFFTAPRGNIIKFDVLILSWLVLFISVIFSSFFWGVFLLFRLGFKDRAVRWGIILGMISLSLVGLMYLRWTLYVKGPNPLNTKGIITNPL